MRVYLPLDLEALADAWRDGGSSRVRAHAATDALRQEWPEGGEEEWEYVALLAAADESAEDQSAGADDPAAVRRVVVAADASGCTPDPERGVTAVVLDTAVAVRDWASVHADVDPVPVDSEDDLAWFAVDEVDDLLGE